MVKTDFDMGTTETGFEEKAESDDEPREKKMLDSSAIVSTRVGMRVERDVYNRILWDENLDVRDFTVGFVDVDPITKIKGVKEVNVKDYDTDVVPMHNIRFFKYRGQIVWDRVEKVDNFFGSRTRLQHESGETRYNIYQVMNGEVEL